MSHHLNFKTFSFSPQIPWSILCVNLLRWPHCWRVTHWSHSSLIQWWPLASSSSYIFVYLSSTNPLSSILGKNCVSLVAVEHFAFNFKKLAFQSSSTTANEFSRQSVGKCQPQSAWSQQKTFWALAQQEHNKWQWYSIASRPLAHGWSEWTHNCWFQWIAQQSC